MELRNFAFVVVLACFSLTGLVSAQTQTSKQLTLQSKETNTANFFRLLIMRLIFGVASAMGFGENLSEFFGGALVPPGADYDDDYDYLPDLF